MLGSDSRPDICGLHSFGSKGMGIATLSMTEPTVCEQDQHGVTAAAAEATETTDILSIVEARVLGYPVSKSM